MTERSLRRLGRPAFGRRTTIGLATAILVVLAFAMWDYVEGRRIKADIDRIVAAAEPINAFELRSYERPDDSPAAAYYLAAAALAAGQTSGPPRTETVFESAEFASNWLANQDRRQIFELLDRATAQEFRGFSPGRLFGYRDSDLHALLRFARGRTKALLETGQSEAAIRSLESELMLFGARTRPLLLDLFRGVWPTITNLEDLLRSGEVKTRELDRVAELLSATLPETIFADVFEEQRANLLTRAVRTLGPRYGDAEIPGASGNGPDLFARLRRPFVAHRLHRSLTEYEQLIAAARQPWPQRIQAMSDSMLAMSGVAPDDWDVLQVAGSRVAAVAVAAARYRAEHGSHWPATMSDLVPRYLDAAPIDPYSGEPIRMTLSDSGQLSVYTIGTDRKDDGGPTNGLAIPNRVMPTAGDIGVVLGP